MEGGMCSGWCYLRRAKSFSLGCPCLCVEGARWGVRVEIGYLLFDFSFFIGGCPVPSFPKAIQVNIRGIGKSDYGPEHLLVANSEFKHNEKLAISMIIGRQSRRSLRKPPGHQP